MALLFVWDKTDRLFLGQYMSEGKEKSSDPQEKDFEVVYYMNQSREILFIKKSHTRISPSLSIYSSKSGGSRLIEKKLKPLPW